MKVLQLFLFLSLLALTSFVQSKEYFGVFLDSLTGHFIDAEPRPKFKIGSEFRFKDPNDFLWIVPADEEVDGASIPQVFWSLIGGPFEGAYINASVIHDYYCAVKSRTAHDTHRAFYYGMRAANVPDWKAKYMYWAVATFGPNWKIEKKIKFESACIKSGEKTVCSQSPKETAHIVDTTSVNLEDAEVLAAALSKADAVARSLKTSNGQFLDVSEQGLVSASLNDIDENSISYRSIFSTKSFVAEPAKLGILSQWQNKKLEDILTWERDMIPQLDDAVFLNQKNIKSINAGKQFKVDINGQRLLENQLNIDKLGSRTIHE